jgi:hypothetical protein
LRCFIASIILWVGQMSQDHGPPFHKVNPSRTENRTAAHRNITRTPRSVPTGLIMPDLGANQSTQISEIIRTPTFTITPLAIDAPISPNIDTQLTDIIRKLKPGIMIFNHPDRMRQGKTERVKLRILLIGLVSETPRAPTQTAAAAILTNELGAQEYLL